MKDKTDQLPKLVYKKDARGKYRWSVTAHNNEIVGASSQGFATKQKAEYNAELLAEYLNPGLYKGLEELMDDNTELKDDISKMSQRNLYLQSDLEELRSINKTLFGVITLILAGLVLSALVLLIVG